MRIKIQNILFKCGAYLAYAAMFTMLFIENAIRAILVQLFAGVWYSAFSKTRRRVNKELAELPQWVREKVPFWDMYGYRHNKRYLDAPSTKEYVIKMPLHLQIKYCELFFFEICNSPDYYNDYWQKKISWDDLATGILVKSPKTATDIGNLAMLVWSHENMWHCNLDEKIYQAACVILRPIPKDHTQMGLRNPQVQRVAHHIPEDGC